jgi:hypothetical protein
MVTQGAQEEDAMLVHVLLFAPAEARLDIYLETCWAPSAIILLLVVTQSIPFVFRPERSEPYIVFVANASRWAVRDPGSPAQGWDVERR